MIAVTIANIFAVFLAYLSRNKPLRYFYGFAILFLICFYGIRSNYGNDFHNYEYIFNQLNSYHQLDDALEIANLSHLEIGWVLLNRLFSSMGFQSLVFFITVIQFVSFYFISIKYVKLEDLYIVLFFYLFTSSYLLTMLSMLRQCLAMSIVLFAIPNLVRNRGKALSILIIILAAQFHASAYFMLLLLFIPILYKLPKKMYVLLSIIIMVFFFLGQRILGNQMIALVNKYFQRYNSYFDDAYILGWQRIIILIWDLIFFLFVLFNDPHDKSPYSFFMKTLMISYAIVPLKLIAPLISRVGLYTGFIGLIALAPLYKRQNQNVYMQIILVVNVIYTLFRYFEFFYDPTWKLYYLNYHTIFS